MAGTITMAGLASGFDVEGIITGLVNASSASKQTLQQRASDLRAASSTVSSVASALSSLRSAADVMASLQNAASFTASSSDSAIVAQVSGAASPSSYTVDVKSLAHEQRTYSSKVDDHTAALAATGSIQIQVGSGTPTTIDVASSDSMDSVVAKINAAGIRASASVFYDGTGYRMQIRGLDTGAANALHFTETGTTFDLNGDGTNPDGGKTAQAASDATAVIDGYTVSRPNNQIAGVVPGVTLALTALTSSPATVTVASDAATLKSRVTSMVTAYNAVITRVQQATGYGSSKASNALLAADPSLRGAQSRLTQWATSTIAGTGSAYSRLADIGVTVTRDGTLQVDSVKLQSAIDKDAGSVAKLLAKPQGSASGGAVGSLESVIDSLTQADGGVVSGRQDSLDKQAKALDDEVTKEQARLDDYATRLRAQFQAMDASVTASKNMGQQITSFFKSSSSSS